MGSDGSSFVQKLHLRAAKKSAWREVRWFYGAIGGRVPKKGAGPDWQLPAARTIRRWLRQLPTFHSGAFELGYTQRDWPAAIAKRFGSTAGVVVRIECARHPSDGRVSDDELEKASLARLEAMIADKRYASTLYDLEYRAYWHVQAAHKAYVGVRGMRPCVLPPGVGKPLREDQS